MALITGLITVGEQQIIVVDSDPSAGAGTPATVGDLAMIDEQPGLWQKVGLLNTQWLRLTTTNDISAGIVNYIVTSSVLFSTSSLTDTLITGFTVTPMAGTYAIWYNASVSIVTNNAILRSTIYRAGVAITDSTRASQASGGNWSGMASTMTTALFNGTQACDVRVRTTTGSISVTDRSLILIRLGS